MSTEENMSNLNIAILMWYDNDTAERFGNISYKINKLYCDKHGYNIIFSNERKHKDNHWEKIPLVLNNIKNYDYVIWIDADAHFYIDSGPISALIKNYPDKDIILSGDIGISLDKQKDNINTGVFIVKNTKEAIEIMERWCNDEYLYNLNIINWDQGVLRKMYNNNILDIQNYSVVVPYGVLQHFDLTEKYNIKPYINHLAGSFKYEIVEVFSKYLDYILNKN
tara:strand:- start:2067 stop:2735 length:669 start_codon:yes stop_codon:yes gene_type:complete